MNNIVKTIAIVVIVVLLGSIAYVGSMYMGWLPVPRFLTDLFASMEGLSPREANTLHQAAELYSTIKRSPESLILAEAEKMVRDKVRSPAAWFKFAAASYPKVSEATLDHVRDVLLMPKEEFQSLKALWEKKLLQYKITGKVEISSDERDFLQKIDDEYQFSAMIKDIK